MSRAEPSGHPERRDEVLAALRSAATAMTIVELAERLDVHPNTVRFHLDKLVTAGRVEIAPPDRSRPGRPPQRFRPVRGMDPAGPRHFRLLAEILVREFAEAPDGRDRAEAAGRAWGSRLSVDDDVREGDVRDGLVALLDTLGFAPESDPGDPGDSREIRLAHCPFLELVDIGPGLVCQVHLGLMRGATADQAVSALVPFAEPNRCLVRLSESVVAA